MASNIIFKSLTENDLLLLHSWFQIPHVKKWYARGKKYSIDMIREKYLPRLDNPYIRSFIVYMNDTPVGYIQFYYVSHHLPDGVKSDEHFIFGKYNRDEIAGIDLFIGPPEYINKGNGSAILKNFINEHLKRKFKLLVTDPLKDNVHAIRFFERNGFQRVALEQDTGLNELMMLTVC